MEVEDAVIGPNQGLRASDGGGELQNSRRIVFDVEDSESGGPIVLAQEAQRRALRDSSSSADDGFDAPDNAIGQQFNEVQIEIDARIEFAEGANDLRQDIAGLGVGRCDRQRPFLLSR